MSRDRKEEANPDRTGEPDTDELLAYLDGELSPERMLAVSQAIKTSWSVQARLDDLQRDITLHSDLSRNDLPPSVPGVEDAWRDFETRLQRERDSHAAAQSALRVGVLPSRRPFSAPWLRVAAGLALTAGIAAYWLGRGPLTHVLAYGVINRAESNERRAYLEVAKPVVHQRMHARRQGVPATPGNVASWELWSRVDGPELHEEVGSASGPGDPKHFASPVVTELKEVFRNNGIDSRRPLSTTAYNEWRKANHIEDVLRPTRTENGDIAFAVTSTAAESSATTTLLETEFTVRASDWHVVGERMKVNFMGEIRQYELTETSYEVVALGTLPVTVFETPETPAITTLEIKPELVIAPPLPLPVPEYAPPPPVISVPTRGRSEIFAAAIETEYALHKLNACIEEQMTVEVTSDGQVVVQGTVLDQARWQQIVDGLSGLRAKPRLEISILAAASKSTAPSATSSAASVADRALLHATALYLTSANSYASDVDSLPRDSRWLMEIMVRDHLEQIAGSLAELRRSAAMAPGGEVGSVTHWPPTWAESAASLLQDIRSLDTLLHEGPQALNSTGDPAQQVLLRLTSMLSDPAALASRWFSVAPARPPASTANN